MQKKEKNQLDVPQKEAIILPACVWHANYGKYGLATIHGCLLKRSTWKTLTGIWPCCLFFCAPAPVWAKARLSWSRVSVGAFVNIAVPCVQEQPSLTPKSFFILLLKLKGLCENDKCSGLGELGVSCFWSPGCSQFAANIPATHCFKAHKSWCRQCARYGRTLPVTGWNVFLPIKIIQLSFDQRLDSRIVLGKWT